MRNPDSLRHPQPARRQQAAVSVLHRAEGLHRRASAGDARRRHDRHRRPQRLRPADEPARPRHRGDGALLHRGRRHADADLRPAGDEPDHAARPVGGLRRRRAGRLGRCPTRTDLPIWIEHADYWNNNKAGRLSQGTGERSDTWYFAEGVVGGTYWIHDNTAYNPSATDRVRVTWQFMNASGTLAEATHEIAPRGSHRVRVNDVPGIEGEHATLVRGVWADDGLPAPIVAERTIKWGNDIEGHSTRGVPFPSPTWVLRRGQPGRTVVDVPAADEPVRPGRDRGGPLPAGDRAVAALHVHRAAAAPVHGGAADHRRLRHRRAVGGDRRSGRRADHRRARHVLRPAVEHRPRDGRRDVSVTALDVRRRIDRRRTLLRSVPAARQPVHRRRARAARLPALERQRRSARR